MGRKKGKTAKVILLERERKAKWKKSKQIVNKAAGWGLRADTQFGLTGL